ncbi:MAG: tetratricopeptide repeat protein [Methanolinea sp.]|nr:tetratricopeptide repeat protein [Methanolinea sp.]
MAIGWNKSGGIPLEAQALYRRAHEVAGRGRYGEAVGILKKSVLIAPRYTRALEEMGDCLEKTGRFREALDAFDRVLWIDPMHEGARAGRERVLATIGSGAVKSAGSVVKMENGGQDHSFMALLATVARQQRLEDSARGAVGTCNW